MHLARLEAQTALRLLLTRLPGLRLAPGATFAPRGLVFRKPAELRVTWNPPARAERPRGALGGTRLSLIGRRAWPRGRSRRR